MTRNDADSLRDLSKVLWDSWVWRVRVNIQHRFEEGYSPEDLDEFCLDFSRPLDGDQKSGKVQRVGSLWFNIRNAGMRLQEQGRILVSSSDSTTKVLSVLPTLRGCRLDSMEVDHPGGDTRFFFDDGRVITCFPANSVQGIAWVIVTEAGDEISLGPGNAIRHRTPAT